MKDKEMMKQLKDNYEAVSMDDITFARYKSKIEQAKRENAEESRRTRWHIYGGISAAVLLLVLAPNVSSTVANAMENIPVLGKLIKVVTIRNYEYDDEKHTAQVEIPEISVDVQGMDNSLTKENVIKSSAQINEQILSLSEQWIAEFEQNMREDGYQDLQISSEIVQSTNQYFTLKLTCYQAMASGYEEHHYYTIDLNTGKKLTLKELFWEDFNYIEKISEEIKTQMREQMLEDENNRYFIDTDMPEDDFHQITEETEFYIDKDNKLVISFHEAEVAPAYMGCVEFVINSEEVNLMRKPCAGYVANGMFSSKLIDSFDSVDELTGILGEDKWYATGQLSTSKESFVLVTDGVYDYGNGTMAAINADLYAQNEQGKIVKYGQLESSGTAYPLMVSDEYIFYAGPHHISKMYIDESCSALLTKESATEIYDEKGKPTYYYFSLEDGFAGKVENDREYERLFSEYGKAEVVHFTKK